MKSTSKHSYADACPVSRAISKDGYSFNPGDNRWKLNKDVVVEIGCAADLPDGIQKGFRSALARYAEELSAMHTFNMAQRFKQFLLETGTEEVSPTALLNWRATLAQADQYQLGALKGFLIAWNDFGFDGVPKASVDLLQGWRIQGNEKGAAVASGCPETGPFTDLEMAALLDWANMAVARRELGFEDFAYLFTLAMTARRPVQISALRGKDLVRESIERGALCRLNIPRAKQRGSKFRGSFRSLAIIEDLYLVLQQQHRLSVTAVENAIRRSLDADLASEIPIFLNSAALDSTTNAADLRELLNGATPDALHATTSSLAQSLQRCARASMARSERTGEYIRLSATRFRYTRGTKLRREGFGPMIIAELLDHSDIQNVRVYTENTAQEAVIIDKLVGAQLAPFAQACLGTLVQSERDAIRGGDPRSRVPNQRQNPVGTCGNYGFCASGYRACYTCHHFQPWVEGPHEEVLADLYEEKGRTKEAGCAEVVVNANDQLILAVEHCVLLCRKAKCSMSPVPTLEGDCNG